MKKLCIHLCEFNTHEWLSPKALLKCRYVIILNTLHLSFTKKMTHSEICGLEKALGLKVCRSITRVKVENLLLNIRKFKYTGITSSYFIDVFQKYKIKRWSYWDFLNTVKKKIFKLLFMFPLILCCIYKQQLQTFTRYLDKYVEVKWSNCLTNTAVNHIRQMWPRKPEKFSRMCKMSPSVSTSPLFWSSFSSLA